MEHSFDVLLEQRVLGCLIAVLVAAFISWLAWRKKFYQMPACSHAGISFLGWRDLLRAFGLFLSLELFVAPLLYTLWVSIQYGINTAPLTNDSVAKGWINLTSIAVAGCGLGFFFFKFLDPRQQREVYGENAGKDRGYNIAFGLFSWVIVYPWMIAIGQIIGTLVQYIHQGEQVDQVAVRLLKDLMNQPMLLWLTMLAIVTIVPLIEELMFRGFLQTWLKSHVGRIQAIVCTSIVFSLFHYSESQGVGNIELLISLFVLSCYLGFLKERQNSLWPSIGLHAAFNFVSLVLIIFAEI